MRHFGFLANRHRKEKLDLCPKLLTGPVTELLPSAMQCLVLMAALTTLPVARCSKCKTGIMVRIGFVPAYRWPARPQDTS